MRNFACVALVFVMALLCGAVYAADGDTNFTNVVASGDITAGDDLTVTDDATVGGDCAITGALTVTGASTLSGGVTYATTKSVFITAMDMKLPTANPAAAAEEGSIGTLSFADSSADDNAWISWCVPADCDVTESAYLRVYYVLPSGTPGEGQWNFLAGKFVDGTAIAAAATEITTIFDTPQASAKMNVTTATTLASSLLADGGIVNINIYHDVDDQFGGAVELIGVRIDYTTSKP